MSLINQIVDGCLLSRDRLMREREFYSPAVVGSPSREDFGHWTQRVSVKCELDAARELAGLSSAELAELETEFQHRPMRRQSPLVHHAVLAGLGLMVLAGVALVLQAAMSLGDIAVPILQAVGIGSLLLGLVPLGFGLVSAFGALPLDRAHGTTGLLVGTLDDRHPWLYRSRELTVHAVAQDYRQRTLLERGPLRGADYVMMRELVWAQQALERVRAARSVAEELQLLPAEAPSLAHEPRLVRVGSTAGRRATGNDAVDGVSQVAAN